MLYLNYVDLKSKSKVQMKKDAATEEKEEFIYLESKKYDSETGEEVTPVKVEITLKQLEREKSTLEDNKVQVEKSLTELEALITDIKAL